MTVTQTGGLDAEGDCRALLGLFLKLGQSLKGHRPQDRRLVDSEMLAQKIVFHACSILYLFRGTRLRDIPEAPVDFVDHASILVVARALVEAVWAFHHIFVEAETKDETTFRYSCWMLAGFVQREKFPALTKWGREQLARDSQAVSRYREELQSTEAFGRLTPKEQKRALGGRLWRPGPLKAMAEKFLGKRFGGAVYTWLSSYQHGDALSAVQVRSADTAELQRKLAESSLLLAAISLGQMVQAYLKLWPHLEFVISLYPNIRALAEFYSQSGESLDAVRLRERRGLHGL